MIKGISHVTLIVKDLEKSSLLFQSLFDAVEVYSSDAKEFSVSKEKFLVINGLWIALMEGSSISRSYNHIAFHAPQQNFSTLRDRMCTLGLEIVESRKRHKEEGDSLYFYDYDNHLFEIHSGSLNSRLAFYHSVEERRTCRYVSSLGSIRLWVEGIGDPSQTPVILIAGAGAHARFWTNEFCQKITSAGYFVIRFDHRDTGYSSSINYEKEPYTVFDIAKDVLSILDAFQITKAHIVGHSMGGVIAQILAYHHSDKIKSFVSMSAPKSGSNPSEEIMKALLENKPTQNFETSLEGFMKSWKILNGDVPLDEEMAEQYTKELYYRSLHPVDVAWNHIHAQENISDFAHDLSKVTVPGLFLHGEKDVLINVEEGRRTASCTKNALFESIPKMGHMFFDRATEDIIATHLIRFFSNQKI